VQSQARACVGADVSVGAASSTAATSVACAEAAAATADAAATAAAVPASAALPGLTASGVARKYLLSEFAPELTTPLPLMQANILSLTK
jgi:hypothetical protein